MFFDSSIGIDFRKNDLILTCLRHSWGKIRLVGYGVHPLPPESQKEEREAQLVNLIHAFVSKQQIHRERFSISLSREKVVIRFLKLPIATKENLRKVLEYEIPRYTPFEKGEVYFDYQLLKEEKDWVHLMAAFAKKADVDYLLSLLKKAGVSPLSIQIPSVAALNLFFYHGGTLNPKRSALSLLPRWPRRGGGEAAGDGAPAVLLDVAGPSVEINLIREKQWVESLYLPLKALGNFTSAIDTVVSLLRRTGLEEGSLARSTFFVYGLGADEFFSSSLKAVPPVQRVSAPPLNRLDIAQGGSDSNRIYGSIGLALRELTNTPFQLNLLPVEMRKKVRQIGRPLLISLAVVALILSITWGTGTYYQYREAWNAVNGEIKKKKPEIDALEKLQKQKEQLNQEVTEFEKIEAGEPSKVDILRELAQVLPPSAWVWDFKYDGKEIEISGFADSASDLIPLLDRSPVFEGVQFMAPVTKEMFQSAVGGILVATQKERFKIKMRLRQKK